MADHVKSLDESIISIRVKLQNSSIKKSGKNKYAGFTYFELADFLPKLNELMLEEKMNDRFYIDNDSAILELVKGNEVNRYIIPYERFDTPLNKDGKQSMQDIQYLGALNTYYKRYLYLNAFGITDGEVIESLNNDELKKDDTNYKQLLMDKLKELNIDIQAYAKEHNLSSRTSQNKAKQLLESLVIK